MNADEYGGNNATQYTRCAETVWAEAVSTACFIRNQLVTKSFNENRTPYKIIHETQSGLSYLCKSGWKMFGHKPAQNRKRKLDSRSDPKILVGCYRKDGYRVLLDRNVAAKTKDANFNGNSGGSVKGMEHSIECELKSPEIFPDNFVRNARDELDTDNEPDVNSSEEAHQGNGEEDSLGETVSQSEM